ncbi:MAG: hypothetical protein ABID64_03670 [Nitrospirota bacterium]
MNVKSFISLVSSSETISGDFDFTSDPIDALMDRDFENKKFVDCKIVGGDFASGIFLNCSFDKVLFREAALVGVSFDNCHFIDCKFSKVECDFSMENCKIDHLIIAKED